MARKVTPTIAAGGVAAVALTAIVILAPPTRTPSGRVVDGQIEDPDGGGLVPDHKAFVELAILLEVREAANRIRAVQDTFCPPVDGGVPAGCPETADLTFAELYSSTGSPPATHRGAKWRIRASLARSIVEHPSMSGCSNRAGGACSIHGSHADYIADCVGRGLAPVEELPP